MGRATKADLTKEAEALGVDVDGRWSAETLQEKIDAAKAAKAQEGQGDAAEESEAEGEESAGTDATSGDGGSQAGDAGGEATDGTAVAGEPSGAAALVASPAGTADGLEQDNEPDGDHAAAETVAAEVEALPALEGEADYVAAREAMTWPMLAAFQAASSVRGIARGEQTGGFALDMGWMPGVDAPGKIITLVRHAVPFVRTWPDAPPEALYGHVASGGGVNLVLDVAWADLDLADRASWTVFRDTLVTLDRFVRDFVLTEGHVDDRPSYPVSDDDLALEEADERFAPSAFGRGEA